MDTPGGIQAGVMWTIVAGIHGFIKDRWKLEPDSTVIFTGGDGQVGIVLLLLFPREFMCAYTQVYILAGL